MPLIPVTDMYDLAAERSHAAALQAELKCLKATAGPPTVAYEVVEVPVQSDDIPPPELVCTGGTDVTFTARYAC